ncbi:acyl-CoA dehydrogenase family protein [Agromyces sp. H3Y2-19a]|uniref:acyl-CoA dehydrogenase family protein n=1 Tax=Agromyces TaxID=33877 RepID=UPI001E484EC4|nr:MULTISPECIES: acyl-CoA dehydrogenase family protein [Agromyces]MCD5348344.1 acyl-CoA dehydrogenase family protein [Agromyces sp. S2-1-8]MDF0514051.1 acyl-CoA dehydrogenase family protein [Agromyces chromiiresistens]
MTTAPRIDQVFDFDALLTEEERGWQQKARGFAQERILPIIEEDFENKHFRKELIPELGAAGFLGMHLKGYGCAGAGAVAYGLVCLELEAADSGWRTFVSVQGSLAMSAIYKYGSEEQKQQWLPGMAAGELVGCFALTEPQGGSDPAAMSTVARREGDEWVIDGAKRWIGLAALADVAVVWARVEDPSGEYGEGARAVRGFIVPTSTAGFTATAIDGKLSMRASVQCDIDLDGVRLPADAILPGAAGLSGPFGCLNEARYGIVWGAMGAARSCLEVALDRSITREVFGKPIGANQLTQAKLADMFLEVEKGTLLALHLGRLKEAGTLTPAQISVGKLNSVREALEIAHQARTILGGDGITNAFPVMRHAANLESVRTYEGTDEIHQLILGRALTGLNAF